MEALMLIFSNLSKDMITETDMLVDNILYTIWIMSQGVMNDIII